MHAAAARKYIFPPCMRGRAPRAAAAPPAVVGGGHGPAGHLVRSFVHVAVSFFARSRCSVLDTLSGEVAAAVAPASYEAVSNTEQRLRAKNETATCTFDGLLGLTAA